MLTRLFHTICVAILSYGCLVQCNYLSDNFNKLSEIVDDFFTKEGDVYEIFENAKDLPEPLVKVSLQISAEADDTTSNVAADVRKKDAKRLFKLMCDTITDIGDGGFGVNQLLKNVIFNPIKDFSQTCDGIHLEKIIGEMNAMLKKCLKTRKQLRNEKRAFKEIRAAVNRILTRWVDPVYVDYDPRHEKPYDTYFAIRHYIERTNNTLVVENHVSKVENAINQKFNSIAFLLHPDKVIPELDEFWRTNDNLPPVSASCPIAHFQIDQPYVKPPLDHLRRWSGGTLFLVTVCSAQRYPNNKALLESVIALGQTLQEFMHMVAQRVADKNALFDVLSLRKIAEQKKGRETSTESLPTTTTNFKKAKTDATKPPSTTIINSNKETKAKSSSAQCQTFYATVLTSILFNFAILYFLKPAYLSIF